MTTIFAWWDGEIGSAAKGLAEGKAPPAVGAGLDYASVRGAEKILEPGEDWRALGTDDDPVVREALGQSPDGR